MNMKRSNTLDNKSVDKYNFYCSKALYELYYKYTNNIDKANKYIRKSLQKNSFILFYFPCLMY